MADNMVVYSHFKICLLKTLHVTLAMVFHTVDFNDTHTSVLHCR